MSADALLAAIRAEPEEDTPRLAYADLLGERGGEADRDRAEYIRASVELDRAKEEDPVLKARVKELWERYGAAWSAPLAGDGGLLDGPQRKGFLSFARGFIDRINLDGESLVRHGETIHRLAPVTRLSVSYLTDGQLAEVVRKPWLRSVRTLE